MNKLVVLLVMIVMLAAVNCPAVLVDLPELTGDYSIGGEPPAAAPWTRTMTFTLPDSIESLTGLMFLASGPWVNAQLEECRIVQGITYCDTLPTYTNLTLRLTADPLGDCHFQATVSAFDFVNGNEPLFAVCTVGQSDVNLLLGASITAELFCDVAPETLPHLVEAAFGTLHEVQLEVVGAVPITSSAWGAVKSQYR